MATKRKALQAFEYTLQIHHQITNTSNTFFDSIYTLTLSSSTVVATYFIHSIYLDILWNYTIWSVQNSGYKLQNGLLKPKIYFKNQEES